MIDIIREPIDCEALLRTAGEPSCGAVLSFSGTVRDHHHGRAVVKLAYEAYPEMALKEMGRVAEEAQRRWPALKRVQIIHRFGEMPVGEASIFISVATPHRPEAFEALRFIIDTIKRDVPIWKKEFYADGASDWLHPEEGCCAHEHRQ